MATALDRLGFHYYPDDQHFTERDLALWAPELQAIGARWLILRGNNRRAVPEAFVRGLVRSGIQPIIHIPVEVGAMVRADLDAQLQAYAHWGVRHVAVFDRPNLRRSWREADWSRPSLIDRYLDALLPVLQAQQASGLRPLLPPLEPGGDYWDTAFLQATLEALARRAPKALLSELGMCVLAWSHGRPLTWGAGGPSAWKDARPYEDPPHGEDQRGIRIFEWYQQIAQAALGADLPMIITAGGISPGTESVAEDVQIAEALAVRRMLASTDDARGVQAFAFYPLAADPEHPDVQLAWYRAPASPTAVAQAFLDAAAAPAAKNASEPILPPVAGRRYILLPPDVPSVSTLDWATLGRMAVDPGTSMGANLEDAARFPEVVLAGPITAYPIPVIARLEATGCIILQRSQRPAEAPAGAPPPHAACAHAG
jgi:hypothetical protein